MNLRDEVWFRYFGEMTQAPWGMMVKLAYDETKDERIFGDYTDEEIWDILKDINIIKVEPDDFCDWVESEGSPEEVWYWIFNEDKEDDTIYELSYSEWEKLI